MEKLSLITKRSS